ncbi:hypothetical protein FEM48_Zijuj11G0156700 [Ziziphus jujuba var. spinosa]|uniref:Glycosyltransferase N-terminal domain-containing protein n=1 Tax=Ziziphus jujuba var. spinosa TaxID=714518 RepID=A0A978UJT6_ZIZJJ|nr:hypothetical protein FEM48_Zijuj11G0156700 [Ziziphus jujuba var. spinosa]
MELKPHVVMVPLPFQGHIKPFLCLAQLLSQTGLYITFVNTRYNHKRFSNLSALSLQFPNLQFESISDGMPDEDDQPRSLTFNFFYGLKYQAREHLKELIGTLSRRSENAQSPPITCIIGDGSVSFPVDVAEELGIPVISFCCHSAHYLLANICIPKLIEDGQLPYHEEKDTNHRINIEVAGLELEGRLRLKDLPDFCVLKDVNDPAYQFFVNEALAMTRSNVWRIGVELEACDRWTIQRTIKTLMEGREEFQRSVDKIAKWARDSIGKNGSSCHNLEMLVEDIKKIKAKS